MSRPFLPIAEFSSEKLRLRLVAPPSDLAPYLSGYYRTEVAEGATVEDWLPPEEANLRTGEGEHYRAAIGNEEMRDVPPAIISGPTDRVTRLRITHGKFWGIGLTPAGWSRLIGLPTHESANSFVDIGASDAPASLEPMLHELREIGDDLESAAQLINATLRDGLEPDEANEQAIQAVHRELISEDHYAVAPLAEAAGMNPRTLARFCQRHFGFVPRSLLRRQRFLRSLGQYMLDPSMRWINSLDSHYWDQAHFIRDFRATMGMTPSEYAKRPHPIVTAAVTVIHQGGGVAMQALYHPDHARAAQTGL